MAQKREQSILSSYHYTSKKTGSVIHFTSDLYKEKRSYLMRAPSTSLLSSTTFKLHPSDIRERSAPLVKPDLLPHILDPTVDHALLHFYPLSLYY